MAVAPRRTPEDANPNQYWVAPDTISMLVQARAPRLLACAARAARLTRGASPRALWQEVETHATRVAFISTPSVYFSLTKSSALGQSSRFFDVRAQARCFARTRVDSLPALRARSWTGGG